MTDLNTVQTLFVALTVAFLVVIGAAALFYEEDK